MMANDIRTRVEIFHTNDKTDAEFAGEICNQINDQFSDYLTVMVNCHDDWQEVDVAMLANSVVVVTAPPHYMVPCRVLMALHAEGEGWVLEMYVAGNAQDKTEIPFDSLTDAIDHLAKAAYKFSDHFKASSTEQAS